VKETPAWRGSTALGQAMRLTWARGQRATASLTGLGLAPMAQAMAMTSGLATPADWASSRVLVSAQARASAQAQVSAREPASALVQVSGPERASGPAWGSELAQATSRAPANCSR
jgi:hypothetical protein